MLNCGPRKLGPRVRIPPLPPITKRGNELKADKNYKMSKQGKRDLAQIIDPHYRGVLKRAIIASELAAAVKVKPSKTEFKANITPEESV